MALELLYFAWVRERVGTPHELVEPPEDVADVAGLVAWLSGRSAGHAAAFAEPGKLRAAVDQKFVGMEAPIAGAREVALFPPVTGG
ncbi:molybdopterin converting factor subunit 1 [Sphingomonas sp.]|uniref:molybdopterin converting factor subunit 1 n=1 Tax=Sphingomonas sp. TaxID=28214 RepID=UPI001B1A9BB3|nr:molybdopterin converting factor subunit 1 [Sphingomonas sp.]MBO9712719.1 molybdopterin converting factor subunit 1 [Sphingomonas sp.]